MLHQFSLSELNVPSYRCEQVEKSGQIEPDYGMEPNSDGLGQDKGLLRVSFKLFLTALGYLDKLPRAQRGNMNDNTRKKFEARAKVIKSLGHPLAVPYVLKFFNCVASVLKARIEMQMRILE